MSPRSSDESAGTSLYPIHLNTSAAPLPSGPSSPGALGYVPHLLSVDCCGTHAAPSRTNVHPLRSSGCHLL